MSAWPPYPFSSFAVDRNQVKVSAARSGGAGGQHVNKTSTKIELRFVLSEAYWIPDCVKHRLQSNFASRINREGEFLVSSEFCRSQSQNLEDAFRKLEEMIQSSWNPPKKRIKTRASRSSQEKRIDNKKKHSQKKQARSKVQ